jgi:hypothetical protein
MYARTAQVEYNTCSLANGFTVGTLAGVTTADVNAPGAFVSFVQGPLTLAVVPTALPGPHPSVNDINRGLVAAGLDKVYDADNSFADPLNPTLAELQNAVPSVYCTATYQTCEPILASITIEAHGIPLYRDIPADFFNHYVPLTYGGAHIATPSDCGVQMITFNLYPGSYQPSGHVNISRAREFYIEFYRTQVNNQDDNSEHYFQLESPLLLKVHVKTCASDDIHISTNIEM